MSNAFFQGGQKFSRGASLPLRPPGYGPENRTRALKMVTMACKP